MKKTKILALILAVVAVICMLAACNGNAIRVATVTIKITDPAGNDIASGLVTVKAEDAGMDELGANKDNEVVGPSVLLAIEQFLQEQDIPFAEDSYGNSVVVIGDIDNSSSDSEYIWTFKINGKDGTVGMAAERVYDQDTLTVYCKKNPYANIAAE